VIAAASGFYGAFRNPGDQFYIAKKSDLGTWMIPEGWEASKEQVEKRGGAAKKKADKAMIAAEKAAQSEVPQGFSGLKETYGEGDFVVTSEEAIAAALEESDMDVKAWNATSVADRKTKIMKKVGELIKAKQEGADKQE
jgi:hypothetical protein